MVFSEAEFRTIVGVSRGSAYESEANGEATSRRRGKRYPVPGAKKRRVLLGSFFLVSRLGLKQRPASEASEVAGSYRSARAEACFEQ